ncbi:hypothetical protein [Rhizobium sp. L43]|uniref:hypothetical protein n=1 Tax=Rhizobium sp. L43 TaxID=2035452 RepID=UPI000BE9A675|nr:hypothetical protein [Rhizobium sp. L43]PDS75440.1 hypothetical protein CO667_26525 [Rhizobium sp. L43]
MEEASNSESGIGQSLEDAAKRIESILGSGNATTDVNAESAEDEVEETSTPSDDVFENSDEQSLEDSDERLETEEDEAAVAEVAPIKIADDLVFEIDGEKITGKQWKEANLRYSDYTRKTQALAEKERGVDTQVDNIRGQAIAHLRNLESTIASYLPQEPNWAQLAQDDPAEYIAQKEFWAARHAQIAKVRHERTELEKQEVARQEVYFKQALADGQRRLHEMHPELAKPETGKAVALGEYLVKAGIPADAISRETNPTLFSIAYKAMQFDQLQAQKAKAVKVVDEKPLLAKPGSSPVGTKGSQSAYAKSKAALKRSGSLEDAAAVLMHRLK